MQSDVCEWKPKQSNCESAAPVHLCERVSVICELFCWPTLTIREIGGAASIPSAWPNLSLNVDFIVKRSLQGWGNCMLGVGESYNFLLFIHMT